MTEAKKIARLVFRKWCKANGIVVYPMAGADLVSRIEAAIEITMLGKSTSQQHSAQGE